MTEGIFTGVDGWFGGFAKGSGVGSSPDGLLVCFGGVLSTIVGCKDGPACRTASGGEDGLLVIGVVGQTPQVAPPVNCPLTAARPTHIV